MRRAIKIFCALAFIIGLGACQTDADQDLAPVLDSPQDQATVSGSTLSFTLNARSMDGHALRFTSDGSVGAELDPYRAATPATFDAANAIFSWSPTDAEAGKYSVQFTVTDDSTPSHSARVSITILVYGHPEFGLRLYGQYCANCHGVNAIGTANVPRVAGSTRDAIANALATKAEMAHIKSQFTAEQIDWLAAGLVKFRTQLARHADANLDGPCASCHNGVTARGMPDGHALTSKDCGQCHTIADWGG